MGRRSFSPYQRHERTADIEPLTRLAVADIMTPNADTVAASLSLDDAVTTMMKQNRRWAPVVDGNLYVGLIAVTDIADVPRAEWSTRTVRDVARTDVLPASAGETVASLTERLRTAGTDAVAVIEDDRVIGIVTRRDLGNVEVLLDHLANAPDP
jgi:CBS domain-containing protein